MIVVMNKVYICVNQHFVNLLGEIEKLLRDALNFVVAVVVVVPCRKFELPYLCKAQQPQEQRCPFLSVCVVFSYMSKQLCGCHCYL